MMRQHNGFNAKAGQVGGAVGGGELLQPRAEVHGRYGACAYECAAVMATNVMCHVHAVFSWCLLQPCACYCHVPDCLLLPYACHCHMQEFTVNVGHERFIAPELFFTPDIAQGPSHPGMPLHQVGVTSIAQGPSFIGPRQ